jgi:hypothetical protein
MMPYLLSGRDIGMNPIASVLTEEQLEMSLLRAMIYPKETKCQRF